MRSHVSLKKLALRSVMNGEVGLVASLGCQQFNGRMRRHGSLQNVRS